MTPALIPTLFDYTFTDATNPAKWMSKAEAEKLFSFFNGHALFTWTASHNGCEARADAVCILLQQWKIPHYKAWVFSGGYLKNNIGGLRQNWNYHVAAVLPVKEEDGIVFYIIDPATANTLQRMEAWAAGVTAYPHSYHFIKLPHWYLFHQGTITSTNWYARNRQNRKWMLQGLAGINGLTNVGKAQLCFCKERVKKVARAFQELKREDLVSEIV
ncbi:MAG: protein-glutamine glutaminase family protein [Bacteroidota bacterium]